MRSLRELEKRIEELEAKIAVLSAPSQNHYHYHFAPPMPLPYIPPMYPLPSTIWMVQPTFTSESRSLVTSDSIGELTCR